jgi:hypothetical protein
MVLLDWTRMGTAYCLAGVVLEQGRCRVVRPLPAHHRYAEVRNVGWSPFLLDGHARWEVFELVAPEPAVTEAPHVEDVWVKSLRPRRRMVPPGQRREILTATAAANGEPAFGVPLTLTTGTASLEPGTGRRSLATLLLPADRLRVSASQREGVPDVEVRVALQAPEVVGRCLPLKDHDLLAQAEQASPRPEGRVRALELALRQMGDPVAVRLGLSRAFEPALGRGRGRCWLMVDGIFSLSNPEP